MSFSIFFGKFIIFLSLVVFINQFQKLNLNNIVYLFTPPSLWLFIIYFKKGSEGLIDYLNNFFSFLFFMVYQRKVTQSIFFKKLAIIFKCQKYLIGHLQQSFELL